MTLASEGIAFLIDVALSPAEKTVVRSRRAASRLTLPITGQPLQSLVKQRGRRAGPGRRFVKARNVGECDCIEHKEAEKIDAMASPGKGSSDSLVTPDGVQEESPGNGGSPNPRLVITVKRAKK
jgi:hypothetical protein